VWVYNVREQKRVDRIVLPRKANSILVTQDGAPALFAVTTQPAILQAFSALNGKYLGAIPDLSGAPYELFGL
jgi:hypothetical protein